LPANHSSLPAFYFSFALQQGSRGQAVTALQNRLTGAGFYSGPITGYFGLLTKAGVEAYQRAHHVSAIGVVGPLTRAYLNANL
jgi:peptidoglycan hydrolase-like protein with peptidoglycan-binding domain